MKDEIKEIHNELENENKAPTMNNIREKLGLDRIENNNKDEIKAILEFLDDNLWVKYGNTYQKSLTDKECKLLLEHITNLQTIEQQYSAILSENAELENKITNLQEEKEIYKKEKDTLMNSLFITRNKYNNDKARYIRKAKNYKTRIYKAIKLLKDIKYDLDIEPWSIYQVKGNVLFDLLNILQGSDE